jgi:hypothetical protein
MPPLEINEKGKQHQGCVHMVWRKPDKPWPPRDSRKKLAKLLIESKNDKGAQTVVGVVELRFTHEEEKYLCLMAQARNCDEEGARKTYSIGRSTQIEAALSKLGLLEGVWKFGVSAEITRRFNKDPSKAKQLAGEVEKRSRGRKGKAKAAAATNGDDNGNSLRKRKAEAVKESVPDQVGSDITLSLFLSLCLPSGHHRFGHCLASYEHPVSHSPHCLCCLSDRNHTLQVNAQANPKSKKRKKHNEQPPREESDAEIDLLDAPTPEGNLTAAERGAYAEHLRCEPTSVAVVEALRERMTWMAKVACRPLLKLANALGLDVSDYVSTVLLI